MKKYFLLMIAWLMISLLRAQNVGIGTSTPEASAKLDISSTTSGFLPPRMSQAKRDSILSAVAGLQIYNTSTSRPNYYDGFEWMNVDGSSAKTLTVSIGDNYQGGKVAYLLQSGDPGYDPNVQHGLIAAAADHGSAVEWGCFGVLITGADGTAIGTGNQNTIDIATGCSTTVIAAKICSSLVLNGYSDWYLPGKDELNKLYENKTAIGGFTSFYYWSSSEESVSGAWLQVFANGTQLFAAKYDGNYVRAVRSF